MLKKVCLGFAFMASVAIAQIPAINPEFKSLLRSDGVMEKIH